MPEILEIDVEQLMEQIRTTTGKRGLATPRLESTTDLPESQGPADFALLRNSYDVYHVDFTSHRKLTGRLVVLIKSVLRKLLTPILERQLVFNAATTNVTQYLAEQVEGVRQQQAAALQAMRAEIAEQVEGVRQQQAAALQAMRAEIAEQVEGVRQQQAAALQTLGQDVMALETRQSAALIPLRTEILEQVEAWRQPLEAWRHRVEVGRQQMENRFGHLELSLTRVRDNVATIEQLQQESSMRLENAITDSDQRFAEKEQLRQDGATRLEGMIAGCEQALSRLKRDHILQERRVSVLLEEARKRLPEPLNQGQLQVMVDEGKHALDALYVSFEDQFRGTREGIMERLRVYLPLFEEGNLGAGQRPILDVGCGRGEWLQLLKEEGLQGQGIDLNRLLVEECRRNGLEAIEAEAVAYLTSLPPNSVDAVTGFHIIEHLPIEALVRLLDETVRVLKPGGLAIFETPNPGNVLVGSHNFYLDPTHRNPLPSTTVKFLAEARGLCRVEIKDLHPYPEACRVRETGLEVTQRFNEYFYGPQDYAVIGWKV
jgi:O-antigen chain-terminating methyltransferase